MRPKSCLLHTNTCASVARTAQVVDMPLATLLADPAAWAALITLIVMEVVLGIDNLIFISILSNKLPEGQRSKVRRIGISLALIMRLALLSMIAWIVGMTAPVFDLGMTGAPGSHGEPTFETAFSISDRSEEHTSELQSLSHNPHAGFCI